MAKEELKFNIAQSETAFVKGCIFNNWVKGYNEIMQHLRDAVDTEDFINKILGDPELATTTISGRYNIYYYSGLVALVKIGEEAE